jgi:hypothetical protein
MERIKYTTKVINELLKHFEEEKLLRRMGVHLMNVNSAMGMLEESLYVMYSHKAKEIIELWLYHDEGRLINHNGVERFINDVNQFVNFLETEFINN